MILEPTKPTYSYVHCAFVLPTIHPTKCIFLFAVTMVCACGWLLIQVCKHITRWRSYLEWCHTDIWARGLTWARRAHDCVGRQTMGARLGNREYWRTNDMLHHQYGHFILCLHLLELLSSQWQSYPSSLWFSMRKIEGKMVYGTGVHSYQVYNMIAAQSKPKPGWYPHANNHKRSALKIWE